MPAEERKAASASDFDYQRLALDGYDIGTYSMGRLGDRSTGLDVEFPPVPRTSQYLAVSDPLDVKGLEVLGSAVQGS